MGQNISFGSKATILNCDEFQDGKVIKLCDVKPSRIGFTKKRVPVNSLICDFIKNTSKGKRSDEIEGANKLKPLDNYTNYPKYSPELGYKGEGDYGFFTAIYECYNNHWALKTTPDDWWFTLIRTIAMAIDGNMEKEGVKTFFSRHAEKKPLTVYLDDPKKVDYESFFRQITDQIQRNIKLNGYIDIIRSDFSTSTPTHRIVSEITAMSSVQFLFDYAMTTRCGIPYIILLGQERDWVQLKQKFLELKDILKPILTFIGLNEWWDNVETICDKLIESYRGNADISWWNQIFSTRKHKGRGMFSGDDSWTAYDGWFLTGMLNISAFTVTDFRGDQKTLGQIPSGLVSVPLTINDSGTETKGTIAAGIAGIKIDGSKDVPVVESIHGWTILQ